MRFDVSPLNLPGRSAAGAQSAVYYPSALLLCLIVVCVAFAKNSRAAAWIGVWLAICLPIYSARSYRSLEFDLRTVAGIAVVACALLFFSGKKLPRFVLCDAAVLLLYAIQLASAYAHSDSGPLTAFEIAREWVLPYWLGRIAWSSLADLKWSLRIVAVIVTAVSCLAVIECVTHINPVLTLFGHDYSKMYRLGLRRAIGPVSHPIFFGMLLTLFLPWAVEAARQAFRGEGPKWWKFVPGALAAGIFATMSRGPQTAAMLTGCIFAFFRLPRWRLPLVAMGSGVLVLLLLGEGFISELLHRWSGEKGHVMMVRIDGQEYEYTGTAHRYLQFLAYRDALAHAGFIGHGPEYLRDITDAKFREEDIPYLPEDLSPVFWSIDNHYIYFTLLNGWLGVGVFVMMGILALGYLVPWAVSNHEEAVFAACLAGAIATTMLMMLTVFFSQGFGFMWLFCVGVAGSLRSQYQAMRRRERLYVAKRKHRVTAPRRQLVPGHPITGYAGRRAFS